MSKKKNTLKDLDEFLKQQAATLVSPARLGSKIERSTPEADTPSVPSEVAQPEPAQKINPEKPISSASLANTLHQLALVNGTGFTEELCEVILVAMEKQREFSAEEKMLVNTALYLKHGSNWKEAIRQYWKSKNS